MTENAASQRFQPSAKRWLIAFMGTVLQIGLGTVYAWSFFQNPLKIHFGLSTDAPIAWIFSLAICFLGIGAALGGMAMARLGPRKLAMAGAFLYPLGWLLGGWGLSLHSLLLLYLGFGVVGGFGLGLSYVTPVATVAKWFPDKKGLATGMVLMGFGLGALLMSKLLGPFLMTTFGQSLPQVFYGSAMVIALVCLPAAWHIQNPSHLMTEEKPLLLSSVLSQSPSWEKGFHCLFSRRFALMWGVFFCNICAGIVFIGFQSPMLQDLMKNKGTLDTGLLQGAGATLIAVSALFNGVGRMFWGTVADRIGRLQTFRFILSSQVLVFAALIFVTHPWLFGALVCYVLLCYGGGFGTMPSYVLDTFGADRMPMVYGGILTAWSFAGIAGPQLAALIKDHVIAQQRALWTFGLGGVLLLFGLLLTLWLDNRPFAEAKSSPAPN